LKAIAVNRELGFATARVLDRHLARIIYAIPGRHAGRRLSDIPRRLFRAALEVMECRCDGLRRYGDIERHARFLQCEAINERVHQTGAGVNRLPTSPNTDTPPCNVLVLTG